MYDRTTSNGWEEWEMTQIGKMIFDDGYEAGKKEGEKLGERRGESRGKKLGVKRGMDQKVIEQSCRKLRKGKTPEVIAMELEEGLELIQRICQTASRFAPEYDFDQVYGAWSSSRTRRCPP